ncbi:MAG TPA: hypothetical protein VKA36_07265 [Solirubrobacterales bacterium]|nr:hypothetical protein [Solirubrobacterales bacterium]
MELTESEQDLWEKIRGTAGDAGTPKAVCSTLTPFPFWAVIVVIVVFLPLALVAGFVLRRQAVVLQGGEVIVYEVTFFAARPRGEGTRLEPLTEPPRREGLKLIFGEHTFHLQPGWEAAADRLVELRS